jgi:hypothetical protein
MELAARVHCDTICECTAGIDPDLPGLFLHLHVQLIFLAPQGQQGTNHMLPKLWRSLKYVQR